MSQESSESSAHGRLGALAALLAIVLALSVAGCAASGSNVRVRTQAPGAQEGLATWYGERHHGRPTASGERFDMHALTAAHRTLRFGTQVIVTNLENGKTVVVRINDRGPYGRGRIIDVSRAAAERLGMIARGVVRVRVEPTR